MDYSQYLDRVVQLIHLNQKNGQPVTAAVLGSYIRTAITEANFKDFGKRHLRDVLADLEASNRITITSSEKGALAVTPCVNPSSPGVVEPLNSSPRTSTLKKPVWEAFVFSVPAGKRFGHRISGAIRTGVVESPESPEEWVEVAPITTDIQYTWALDFLQKECEEFVPQLHQALTAPLWNPVVFAKTIRDLDPSLARRWNAYRSKMTAEHVRAWLSQVRLPEAWAFEPLVRSSQPKKPAGSSPTGATSGVDAFECVNSEAEARQIILTALGQLPLNKLLELPIPAGVLLNAVASRSSR